MHTTIKIHWYIRKNLVFLSLFDGSHFFGNRSFQIIFLVVIFIVAAGLQLCIWIQALEILGRQRV